MHGGTKTGLERIQTSGGSGWCWGNGLEGNLAEGGCSGANVLTVEPGGLKDVFATMTGRQNFGQGEDYIRAGQTWRGQTQT